jgi:hypothetical protein
LEEEEKKKFDQSQARFKTIGDAMSKRFTKGSTLEEELDQAKSKKASGEEVCVFSRCAALIVLP